MSTLSEADVKLSRTVELAKWTKVRSFVKLCFVPMPIDKREHVVLLLRWYIRTTAALPKELLSTLLNVRMMGARENDLVVYSYSFSYR